MRAAGLKAKGRHKYKATTDSEHALPVAPNLLERDFHAERPDTAWVGDITYIWTRGASRENDFTFREIRADRSAAQIKARFQAASRTSLDFAKRLYLGSRCDSRGKLTPPDNMK
jgi:transposase InsO family protein